jgi:hypothetical protein
LDRRSLAGGTGLTARYTIIEQEHLTDRDAQPQPFRGEDRVDLGPSGRDRVIGANQLDPLSEREPPRPRGRERRRSVPRADRALGRTTLKPGFSSRAPQQSSLTNVSASGPSDVWAIGWGYGSGGLQRQLALHFDGIRWTAVPTEALKIEQGWYEDVSATSTGAWLAGTESSGKRLCRIERVVLEIAFLGGGRVTASSPT